jgi:hypothetical protein
VGAWGREVVEMTNKLMRSTLGRGFRLGLVMIATTAGIVVPAAGATTEPPCTYGDAQALLQELPLSFTQSLGSDRPRLGQLFGRCQFRLFQDGETIAFREDDVVLGGILMFWSYEDMDAFGWTRAEAIMDLELAVDHVEMAVVTGGIAGPFEPVPLIETKYRDVRSAVGHIVFNHRAFIRVYPVGEYLVRWTQSYPGIPDFTSTVRLVVTPA